MGKEKSDWVVWGVRTLIMSGIAYCIYLNKNMTPREKFNDYVKGHETWSQEVLRGLRADVGDIKMSITRIESRLERRAGISSSNITGVVYGRR